MKRFVLFAVGLCLVIGGLFISCAGDSGSGGTHTHSFSEKWKSNDTQHWKECSCGEKDEVADHIAGNWDFEKRPTETETGKKVKKCTVCDYEMESETIPALGENHTHTYDSEYQKDATGHWKVCYCGEAEAKTAHTAGNWETVKEATATETGKRVKKCTVCGYEMESKVIPALGENHTHSYEGEYQKDATGHWKVCDCGEEGIKTVHTAGNWETVKEATATETGKKVKKCTVCGYEIESEVIPKVKYGNFSVSVSIAPNDDVEITEKDLEDTVELEVSGDYTECIWILDGELEYIGKKYVVQKSDLEPGIYPVTVVVDRKYSAQCTITVVEKD